MRRFIPVPDVCRRRTAARAVPLLVIAALACAADTSRGANGAGEANQPAHVSGATTGANGSLVQSTPVTLDTAALDRCEKQQPGTREALADVDVQSVTYLSDGLRVKGYLLVPKKGDKLPCVIYNRGGNRKLGQLNDDTAAMVLAPMARWGYVVVASQYRGNAGGEGREEFGGADVDDVLNLIPLLEHTPRADASRIGICGRSRGGLMTYLALARTDRIAAAAIESGMSDAVASAKERKEMEQVFAELIPCYSNASDKDKDAALRARSPVLWADRLCKRTPILLLQGSADWRVDPANTLQMAAALLRAKHPFRLVLFDGGDHALTEHRQESDRMTHDWLDRYVRDRQPLPNLEPHGD